MGDVNNLEITSEEYYVLKYINDLTPQKLLSLGKVDMFLKLKSLGLSDNRELSTHLDWIYVVRVRNKMVTDLKFRLKW